MTSVEWIAFGGIVCNLVILAGGGAWRIRGLEISLRDMINAKIDLQYKEFGESLAAMRQKIADVELFCRDTYVRRDSFYKVTDDFRAEVKRFEESIEKKFDKLESKIDKMTKREIGEGK